MKAKLKKSSYDSFSRLGDYISDSKERDFIVRAYTDISMTLHREEDSQGIYYMAVANSDQFDYESWGRTESEAIFALTRELSMDGFKVAGVVEKRK